MTFSLLRCICDQAFVRADSSPWHCPACVGGEVARVQADPGPARDKVGVAEYARLTQASEGDKRTPFDRLKTKYPHVEFKTGPFSAFLIRLPKGARLGTIGARGQEVSIYIDELDLQHLKHWLQDV